MDHNPTRRKIFGLPLLAGVISLAACLMTLQPLSARAQGFTEAYWIGKTLWVKPVVVAYKQIEFYSRPTFESPSFFVTKKRSVRVENVHKGWAKVRFLSGFTEEGEGYISLAMIRRFLYDPKAQGRVEYERATFFEEDPDRVLTSIVAAEGATKSRRGSKPINVLGTGSEPWKNPPWKSKPR